MTLEELVIAVRVSAEDAQQTLDSLERSFQQLGQQSETSLLKAQRQVSELVTWIDYLSHVGQASLQEEIGMLERVRSSYELTAEQAMSLDKKIYDARQALRSSEEEKITSLADAVQDALQNRYEEQRSSEQARLAESVAAWKNWSSETSAAIQAQIDALDAQETAEDRAAQEEKSRRSIQKLEQAMLYETDDYNRAQLHRQLDAAQEALAQLQADWAREDERTALRAQLQQTQETAAAEIAALQQESARIDAVYDALASGQSLAAQAQKTLMESSQEELLALLTAYAPDYEATGCSLGEKLYDGFAAAFGDVTAFFDALDAQFEAAAAQAQTAAFGAAGSLLASGQAAAAVSAPVISQTVNFNQPVESPADVTRRMQQVSEELAGMI